MGKYYQNLDRGSFDYDLHPLPGIANDSFRGPAIDRSQPYVACVGAAQTFGRFCARPFPVLLADRLGVQALNLGIGGAGPRMFASPQYLHYLNGAEAVIIQVMSGRSEGNSLFDNSHTGSLQGVRIQDGKSMRFEEFLGDLVKAGPPDRVKRIVEETRENYVRHMVSLLKQIHRPKVLFWFSIRTPDYEPDYSSQWGTLGTFPQLVNRPMVDELWAHCDAYVECVSTTGVPQQLWKAHREIDGTTLENGMLVNRYYPSPEMHAEAAEKLAPACARFVPGRGAGGSAEDAGATAGAVRFVIVCGERTGSNVLRGLLDSHPDCFVAGELFNARLVEKGDLQGVPPSPRDETELADLRRTDPVAFVKRAFEAMESRGHRAIGFKLMYGHADANVAVRDYLASDPNIHVIHLKRRNLLRRWVSERRAHSTNVWAQEADTHGSVPPPVHLQFVHSIWNFAYIELRQAEQEVSFSGHRMLELFYEDLSSDPQSVGARAVAFLGLRPSDRLAVRFQKTGTDSLRDAITNYDELKASILRWASFFED